MQISKYEDMPASFAPPHERLLDAVAALKTEIEGLEPRVCVDHIGSTSVPGCRGKGVIDLAVTYVAGDLEAARSVLARLGFQPQSGRDPFPESRPMRVATVTVDDASFRVHAHVIERDAKEHRELIAFRDALRGDDALRAAYEREKQQILDRGISDSLEYCYAKGAFIESTLRRISGDTAS